MVFSVLLAADQGNTALKALSLVAQAYYMYQMIYSLPYLGHLDMAHFTRLSAVVQLWGAHFLIISLETYRDNLGATTAS